MGRRDVKKKSRSNVAQDVTAMFDLEVYNETNKKKSISKTKANAISPKYTKEKPAYIKLRHAWTKRRTEKVK